MNEFGFCVGSKWNVRIRSGSQMTTSSGTICDSGQSSLSCEVRRSSWRRWQDRGAIQPFTSIIHRQSCLSERRQICFVSTENESNTTNRDRRTSKGGRWIKTRPAWKIWLFAMGGGESEIAVVDHEKCNPFNVMNPAVNVALRMLASFDLFKALLSQSPIFVS
jgi:hypothetical protein